MSKHNQFLALLWRYCLYLKFWFGKKGNKILAMCLVFCTMYMVVGAISVGVQMKGLQDELAYCNAQLQYLHEKTTDRAWNK